MSKHDRIEMFLDNIKEKKCRNIDELKLQYPDLDFNDYDDIDKIEDILKHRHEEKTFDGAIVFVYFFCIVLTFPIFIFSVLVLYLNPNILSVFIYGSLLPFFIMWSMMFLLNQSFNKKYNGGWMI